MARHVLCTSRAPLSATRPQPLHRSPHAPSPPLATLCPGRTARIAGPGQQRLCAGQRRHPVRLPGAHVGRVRGQRQVRGPGHEAGHRAVRHRPQAPPGLHGAGHRRQARHGCAQGAGVLAAAGHALLRGRHPVVRIAGHGQGGREGRRHLHHHRRCRRDHGQGLQCRHLPLVGAYLRRHRADGAPPGRGPAQGQALVHHHAAVRVRRRTAVGGQEHLQGKGPGACGQQLPLADRKGVQRLSDQCHGRQARRAGAAQLRLAVVRRAAPGRELRHAQEHDHPGGLGLGAGAVRVAGRRPVRGRVLRRAVLAHGQCTAEPRPGQAQQRQVQVQPQLQPGGLVHLHQAHDRRHHQGRHGGAQGRDRRHGRHEVPGPDG